MGRLEYNEYVGGANMSEDQAEVATAQVIPDVQKRAIVGIADIRRRSQSLNAQLDLLTKSPTYSEVAEELKVAYKDQLRMVREIMRLDTEPIKDDKDVASHLKIATSHIDIAPNLAALHFTKAAEQLQATGADYSQTLDRAKKCLDVAQKRGIPRTTPADFLPDAYILRIAQHATKDVDLPTPVEVAGAIRNDRSLIRDYALVLPKSQRGEFLAAFPESERSEISMQLDQAVSRVLDSKLISATTNTEQRDAVKERVIQAFADAFEALKVSNYRENRGDHGLGSRWSSRQLTETIVSLGEEDSLRVIRDVAERSIREVKDLNKEIRKKPLSERAQALQPFLSFDARVLDTLIEIDIRRGGTLAMRYLEMSALPERLFNFFAQKLVDKEYFTKNLEPFIDRDNTPVLKKLIARYGPQFNTIVDTLAQTSGYKEDHKLVPNESELFEVLADLETLTPRIFERYRNLSTTKRKEFSERIRQLKPQFFKNVPIKEILGNEDRDILTEMVYMAYKPMGMSFEQVGGFIGKVDDHTEDIAAYNFPEDGYPVILERQGKYVVREKQQVDLDSLRRYRDLFVKILEKKTEGEQELTPFASAFNSLLQPEAEAADHERLTRSPSQRLNALLLPLQDNVRVLEFLSRYAKTNEAVYPIASELAEITGVFFRDNYGEALKQYLTQNPAELEQVISILNNRAVRDLITERLRQFNKEVDWHEFDSSISKQKNKGLRKVLSRSANIQPQNLVSKIIAQLVEYDQIEPVRKHVERELSKFIVNSGDGATYRGDLKAYISKNVGSFFAKATAGICTAQDIPLFGRDNHFHINVVENDENVRANIQAYIAKVKGNPALVLRGFNPTADWVGKIDIGSFCERVLSIAREFQQANGLDAVYITELPNKATGMRYQTETK